MKYIIIGNGIAGVEAAVNIRKNDAHGEIEIFSQEDSLLYYRPRLIEYLSGQVEPEKLLTYKQEWYEERNIKNILGVNIKEIRKESKEIIDTQDKRYKYDKLLLAVGARAFLPDTPGVDKMGVFSLRTIADAERIKSYCKKVKNVVIIGGGLLGIETANNLLNLGVKVKVIEYSDRLLSRQLDNEGSEILEETLKNKGIEFVLKETVKEIYGNDSANNTQGTVKSILLGSGAIIEADAVIYSVGVRGRLELAQAIGLNINRGVLVNEYMETSQQDIYAAGDAIEINNTCYGLWIPAKEQGKIAGENMAGVRNPYSMTPLETRLKITDITLFSAGDIHNQDAKVKLSRENGVYRKLVIKDNKLIGAIVLGDRKEEMLISKVYAGKASLDEIDLSKYKG